MAPIKQPSPPHKLYIASRVYDVRVIESAARTVADAGGSSDADEFTVGVSGWLAQGKQQENLVHEWLHQALDFAGFVDDHDAAAAEIGSELEERLVKRLAPIVLDTIRRNPRLIEYLQA